MKDIVRKDILQVIHQAIALLQQDQSEAGKLKELSNHIIHCATIFQDEDSISLAILVYALSKIIERSRESFPLAGCIHFLEKGAAALEERKDEDYREAIKSIFSIIKKADTKLNLYVGEVIYHASIKKATKMHDHGISVGRASELAGTSQWEMLNYLGKTKVAEHDLFGHVRKRLNYARSMFR